MLAQRERLDVLSSYVPQIVLRQLVSAPAPTTGPRADRFSAALMLVDVTGFTSLTSALVERGASGTEQLSRTLNNYLARIIDIVRDHGGDITKIAGDAVLPVWPAQDEDLRTVTRRAASCGLAVTGALSDLEIEAGVRLSLKVGVCAGEVVAAHVGGMDGRWLFIAAGEGPAQLSAIEAQMQTGGVVLSPAAWLLVADCCVGQALDGEAVRIALVHDAVEPRALVPLVVGANREELVRGYVPFVGLSRLDAGQAEWLGELRRTTVLFADVRGLSNATRDLADGLQAVTLAAQRILGRYQGWLKEITTDDKGTTLVAAFGVPPFTHEDDPARGVQGALAIASELRGLGLGAGIGVATGLAFCGPVGSSKRRDFAMLGPHVNLASRLAQASREGTVLCDAATQMGAPGRATFERLPGYLLKGMPAPVDVHRARAEAPLNGAWPTFVDRLNELAHATERLDALRQRSGGLVVIEGEPGIGKSRFVGEWVRQARSLGVSCVIGSAEEIESSTPYHAWRAVFEQLFDLDVTRDAEARRSAALARLRAEEGDDRLGPLLSEVLSLDLPDNDVTRQLTGIVRADNTRDLLVRLLSREAARAPLLVVLEDAHWLDSASWSLVARARAEIPSFLLVITTRPVAGAPGPAAAGKAEASAITLRLRALSRDDALALASERMGAVSLARPIASLIHERTEGNPLFIEQLTYAMRDGGRIVVEDGHARAAPGAEVLEGAIIPDTVQRVITSRIDQLPPGEALTLKVASVIGPRFGLRTLGDIYPLAIDERTLRGHLDTLARMDLVSPDLSGADGAYAFRHVITQEVAYNLMLPAQSEPLHRSLAEWYERVHAADLSPYHAFLAHHWGKASVVPRAVDHLELAAGGALRSFANEEAVGFLEQAIVLNRAASLGTDARRRARWELQLGEAYVNLSQYAEGRPHLEAGLRLFRQPAPSGDRQQVLWLIAELLRQVLRRAGVLRAVREPIGRERGDHTAVVRAYERLAEASYYARETLLPLYCVVRILNAAEASGIPDEVARGLAGTGALFGLVPMPRVAEWYLERALRMLQRAEDLTTHEIVEIVVAFYGIGAGRWEPAREGLGRVKEIALRLGDRRRHDDAMSNLLELEYLRGSFRRGLELASELHTSALARNDRRFQAEALCGRAYCSLQLGSSGEAMRSLGAVRALAADGLPIDLRIKLEGLLALTHLSRGERHQAIAAAEEAMRLTADQRPTYFGTFAGYVGPLEVHLALCETDPSASSFRAAAKASLARVRRYASVFPIGRPRAWTMAGRYDWLKGERARAFAAWRRAIAEAERLAMPFEEGLAHYEIGRHLDARDPARPTHLAEARTIFRQLNASLALAAADVAAAAASPSS